MTPSAGGPTPLQSGMAPIKLMVRGVPPQCKLIPLNKGVTRLCNGSRSSAEVVHKSRSLHMCTEVGGEPWPACGETLIMQCSCSPALAQVAASHLAGTCRGRCNNMNVMWYHTTRMLANNGRHPKHALLLPGLIFFSLAVMEWAQQLRKVLSWAQQLVAASVHDSTAK